MITMLNITRRTFFILTLLFIAIAIFSLTLGKTLQYEMADDQLAGNYNTIIMYGLPVAILLTVVWTVKRTTDKVKNFYIMAITASVSTIAFGVIESNTFQDDLFTIRNKKILYKQRDDPRIIVALQRITQGKYGESKERIVQLTPFLLLWNEVKVVDTANIDKTAYELVDQQISANIK